MGFSYDTFDGEFDFLPMRAHVLYGDVPLFPSEGDFHHAVSVAFRAADVAADWRVEAIRFRRIDGYGKPLDLKAIALATAARIFPKVREQAVQP